jgi:hypothetical protein
VLNYILYYFSIIYLKFIIFSLNKYELSNQYNIKYLVNSILSGSIINTNKTQVKSINKKIIDSEWIYAYSLFLKLIYNTFGYSFNKSKNLNKLNKLSIESKDKLILFKKNILINNRVNNLLKNSIESKIIYNFEDFIYVKNNSSSRVLKNFYTNFMSLSLKNNYFFFYLNNEKKIINLKKINNNFSIFYNFLIEFYKIKVKIFKYKIIHKLKTDINSDKKISKYYEFFKKNSKRYVEKNNKTINNIYFFTHFKYFINKK